MAVFLLLGVLIIVLVAVRSAVHAARELERAADGLAQARAAGVDVAALDEAVGQARALLRSADDRLSSPAVHAVAAVPVLGRSWDVERAVVRAATSAVAGVAQTLEAAPRLRAEAGIDVDALTGLGRSLAPTADRAREDLETLRATSTDLTPARVQAAAVEAADGLEPVVDGLERGVLGAELVAGLLGADGPRKIYVALQNNAELRGTGGYVSTFAVGQVADGRLDLEPFRDVFDVSDPPAQARRVPAPIEYVEDYGPFLADTTLWREWNMTPDVPDAASVTAEVARVQLGNKPEIVVVLDVPALAAILALADRDVTLPAGTSVSPAELTDALLADTYASAGTDFAEQTARRAALRNAAGATVAELLTDGFSPLALAQELGRLAAGRHVAVWSDREDEQRLLESLGFAGSADPGGDDLALVSVNNINANKLDYYVDRTVSVDATVGLLSAEVVQRVTLRNRAPEGLVPYVAGEQTPGTVVERVELSLSPEAQFRSLRQDGQQTTGDVHEGGERTRVHTFVTLPRDGRVEVEVRYEVPVEDGHYRLRLVPQALAEDASLDVTVRAADGLQLVDVDGAERRGDVVVHSATWAQEHVVEVTAER